MERGHKRTVTSSKWDVGMISMAYYLALLGATDKDLSVAFGVSIDRISVWKRNKLEFREALAEGKIVADAKVAHSLYKNATGYDYYEEQIDRKTGLAVEVRKHHAAESWAAAKWLELRRSNDWSTTQKIDVRNTNTNVNVDFAKLSTEHLNALAALAQISNTKKLL